MKSTLFRLYLTEEGLWVRFWRLLRLASTELYNNNCLSIAKGAAYSSLLSFFPLITTLAAFLVQARADEVARTISGFLYEVVPPGTEDVVRTLFIVHGQRPAYLLVFAVMLAVWAASGAMMSLMEGFDGIYHVPSSRNFIRERGMAILLVFVSFVPVLGASGLIVFGTRAERLLTSWLGLTQQDHDIGAWVVLAGQVLRYGIAYGSFVVVTALIYYLGPNRKQSLRMVFPGAVLATFLWLIATLAFGLYVRHVADYNLLYGSVGAGLALLVWMYVLAVITLLGCEFNAVRERMSRRPLEQS
jgi:membrane protein